jgi:hypothetical protein
LLTQNGAVAWRAGFGVLEHALRLLRLLDQSEEKRERLYPNWQMERVGADDIRDVLQDALESAEDENNIAALKRILDHLATRSLDTLGRAN